MTDIASFLLDLAKGNFSSDEIKAHLERLDRLKRFSSSKAESDAIDLPDDWQPSERAYVIAEQFGQNVQIVEGIFRDYCASSGKLYADHDAAFHNFIRNQKTFNRGSGDAKPKNGIIQAADDLRRKIASFDGPARGTEELRGGQGAAPPRLLSNG